MKRIDVIAAVISALFFTMAAGAQTPKNVKYEFTEASDLAGRDEIKHASACFFSAPCRRGPCNRRKPT